MKLSENLDFDQEAFLGQRILLQGASGAGKSSVARLVIEATYGRYQHLVLDVEDEFHTLRTPDRDYAIVGGENGDAPLGRIEDAGNLALTLLQVGVSAVLQFGDLTLREKRSFVGNFVAGVMQAKSNLWHPTLLMLDESHLFAPNQGFEASSEALTHLATAGRKRGFSAIFATQRLSLFSPDIRAVCENKLLGRVEQALDRRAAADQLGFGPRSEEAMGLHSLEPGQFYVSGPAFTFTPTLVRFPRPQTAAPRPGTKVLPAPTPAAIQKALASISAAATSLDQPLNAAPSVAPASADQLAAAELRGYRRGIEQGKREGRDLGYRQASLTQMVRVTDALVGAAMLQGVSSALEDALAKMKGITLPVGSKETEPVDDHPNRTTPPPPSTHSGADGTPPSIQTPVTSGAVQATRWTGPKITAAQQRALDAIAYWRSMGFHEVRRDHAAIAAGLSPTASTFGVYISQLKSAGLVENGSTGCVQLTQAGQVAANEPTEVLDLVEMAIGMLKPQPARLMRLIAEAFPKSLRRDELADAMGLSRTASTLGVYISECSRLGFVRPAGRGSVRAADFLFPKERSP